MNEPELKNDIEHRVNIKQLDEVCLDCTDFLNHLSIECEDCPVDKLKRLLKVFMRSKNENNIK
jgi:hypothetical protein